MNTLIDQIYKTGYIEDLEGNRIRMFPTSIPYHEGVMLYNLIRMTKSKKTLEIGMAYGLSTLFMCQAHHDNGSGQHIAIDPWEKTLWKSIGLSYIQRAGLSDFLSLYETTSHEALPLLLADRECFNVIFIDGNHLFDHTLLEFFYTDKLLKPGGYMIFDDINLPAIRKVLTFILRNRNYQLANEFIESHLPFWKRCLKFIHNVAQMPVDIVPAIQTFSMQRYCTLQKITDDNRKYYDYKAF